MLVVCDITGNDLLFQQVEVRILGGEVIDDVGDSRVAPCRRRARRRRRPRAPAAPTPAAAAAS